MILLIDNYDSFVHNLARYFQRLGEPTTVVRNDAIDAAEILRQPPRAVVLSPGPCTPNEAGASLDIVRQVGGKVPLLGICLGHQTIAAAWGAKIVRAPEPVHGRSWPIHHAQAGIFAGLPSPLQGCRYHSLIVERETLPAEFAVTAWTSDGLVMAIEHRDHLLIGLQFHPESILTDAGFPLLAAFLRRAGAPLPANLPTIGDERAQSPARKNSLPATPVTF